MKIKTSFAAGAAFLLVSAYFISAQTTPSLMSGLEGNVIIAKLEDGDSLFPKIAQISQVHGLRSGMVLFSIGQLRDFEVGQYNPSSKRYVSQRFLTPWELVSLQGTIANGAASTGEILINCQATLADSSGRMVVGHLSKGIVSLINEISILKLSDVNLFRNYNVELGLWGLDIY